MSFNIRNYIYASMILLSAGCKNTFDEPVVTAGNADFSRYVSVGGYYASGYGDGALYYDLQQYSFPALLASRLSLVGSGEFRQPMVNPGPGLGYDQNKNVV